MPAPSTSAPPCDSAAGSGSQRRLVRHLDLFSGIGGFALAAKMVGSIETVAFCEREPFAQAVLRKHWPEVPICDDIHKLKGNEYGRIDLVTGGYPCQPFSYAGKRMGEKDDRHLWPEMRRIIEESGCRWVLAENVAGHVTMGLDEVLSDLGTLGYSAGATVLPACGVDSPHRRERVWVVAHRSEEWTDEGMESLQAGELPRESGGVPWGAWDKWIHPSYFPRAHDGLSGWVDRNQGLGNAIVPQVAAEILRCMMAVDSLTNDQDQV